MAIIKRKIKTKRIPRQPRVKRRRPARRVRTVNASAPINTASTNTSRQPKSLTQTNTDRLAAFTIKAGTARGTVMYDQIITPTITRRLSTQASLFQRVKYHKLTFDIQTQAPTTVSGGFVAAYYKDPSMDVGTGVEALNRMAAVQGSKTSKNWVSLEMPVTPSNDKLYTANGNDIRLFSPGRFRMLTDGTPSIDVNITINLVWTCTFSEPALQRLPLTLPLATLTASYLKTIDNSDELKAFNRTNQGEPDVAVPMEDAFPMLPTASTIGPNVLFYQLPSPFMTLDSDGNPHVLHFMYFKVGTTGLQLFLSSSPDVLDPIENAHQTYFAWRGFSATPVVPSEFIVPTSTSSGFWSVSQSPSVNQQSMISKQYLTPQRIESSSDSTTITDELSQLSTLLAHQ
nr:coat protein [Nodaviridae sp.]